MPDTWDQQVGEIWQQQLARIGLRLRLRLVAYAAFLSEASRRHTVAMGTTGWTADFVDPSNFLEPTLSSDAIADEGSQNVAFFSSAALDAELARARAALDPAVRRAAFARAESIVASLAPWVPTYSTRALEIWQPYVRGYTPHPFLPQDFRGAWIEQADRTATAMRAVFGPLSREVR